MSGFRLPAPSQSSGAPPALAHYLSQSNRIVEQGLNGSVQNGQDYEVGGGKIWLTAEDGTRYYLVVDEDGRITTNADPSPPAKGYIDGCIMGWNSATSLTVSTGDAYIEGLGRVLEVPTAITKSSLSLSASTWYHLYLYDNAGTPDIEVVTTTPVLYSGTAASKSGDNTRRYIGSVRTNASSQVLQFIQVGDTITYLYDAIATGRKLSGGSATTAAAVDLSSVVPGTSRSAQITVTNGATSAVLVTRSPDQPSSGGLIGPFTFLTMSGGNETVTAFHPTSASQQIEYLFLSAPGGSGAFIDVLGYRYTR